MKRVSSICIALLLAISLLPIKAQAAAQEQDVFDQATAMFVDNLSRTLPEFAHWQESTVFARENLYSPADLEIDFILYELNSQGSACGYLILDAGTQKVVEFSSGVSPYRQVLDAYRQKKLSKMNIASEKLVYYPGEYAVAVTFANSPETRMIEFMADPSVVIELEGISRMDLNQVLAAGELSAGSRSAAAAGSINSVHYKLISGVPDANYTISCIPTAIGNVIGYWDTHGYPNLIVSPATIYTAIAEINERLIDACGNNRTNSAIPAATQGYCKARYPNNFTVTNHWNPAYSTYTTQINYNRPTLVGFASDGPYVDPHMTAGVGYYWQDQVPEKYVIVHDAWLPADDHYQLWDSDYNDFIAKIIP
jgi:hypothetical protein